MRLRSERGAALVEMAILTPFLVLFTFGVIEFGHAFFVSIGVQEAAQEGVAYAAANPGDPTEARTRAVEASTDPALVLTDVVVTCPSSQRVSVTVNHSASFVTPLISQIFGPSIDLTHTEISDVLSTSGSCTASP